MRHPLPPLQSELHTGKRGKPIPSDPPSGPWGDHRYRTHKIRRYPGHNPALPSQQPYGPDPT